MKKHLFLAIFLIFSLPFFALDFSENFTQFYQSDFSEENRQLFYNNLLELEKTDDISFLLFDNEEAWETFSKIQELSNHPLNQEEKTELTTLCFHFMELYHDSHSYGEKLLAIVSVSFCIAILTIIFLLVYASKKEKKLRRIQSEAEISKAIEEARIQTQNSERKAIYQILHDTISQNTKVEQIFTEKLRDFIKDDSSARELYGEIKKLQNENLAEIRNILTSYEMPQEITSQSVEELCANLKNITKLEITLFMSDKAQFDSLSPSEKENIYNIIKESLNNAFRHANAKTVSVIFRTASSAAKGFTKTLLIIDDGTGFETDSVDKIAHHGLEIMKKRASFIGGFCTITSSHGNGTTICVEW